MGGSLILKETINPLTYPRHSTLLLSILLYPKQRAWLSGREGHSLLSNVSLNMDLEPSQIFKNKNYPSSTLILWRRPDLKVTGGRRAGGGGATNIRSLGKKNQHLRSIWDLHVRLIGDPKNLIVDPQSPYFQWRPQAFHLRPQISQRIHKIIIWDPKLFILTPSFHRFTLKPLRSPIKLGFF